MRRWGRWRVSSGSWYLWIELRWGWRLLRGLELGASGTEVRLYLWLLGWWVMRLWKVRVDL